MPAQDAAGGVRDLAGLRPGSLPRRVLLDEASLHEVGCVISACLVDEVKKGKLVVIDGALVGMAVTTRPGLSIGAGAIVGNGSTLTDDARCSFVHGDFFALVAEGIEPGEGSSPTVFDAILVDIDHTPSHHLHDRHADFYSPSGLQRLHVQLIDGGVFALWSDDPPDSEFVATLRAVFADVVPHVVAFPNFYTGGESACTVYVATT